MDDARAQAAAARRAQHEAQAWRCACCRRISGLAPGDPLYPIVPASSASVLVCLLCLREPSRCAPGVAALQPGARPASDG